KHCRRAAANDAGAGAEEETASRDAAAAWRIETHGGTLLDDASAKRREAVLTRLSFKSTLSLSAKPCLKRRKIPWRLSHAANSFPPVSPVRQSLHNGMPSTPPTRRTKPTFISRSSSWQRGNKRNAASALPRLPPRQIWKHCRNRYVRSSSTCWMAYHSAL